MKIAIAYCSGAGHTRALAGKVADGARSLPGAGVQLVDVTIMGASGWDTLAGADAIVFGCPTYMGSAAAAFKVFMDESSDIWGDQLWRDKVAAGFTVATFPSGDKLATLMQLSVFAAQHGMIWVGQDQIGSPVNPDHPEINSQGSWLGLMAMSVRDKSTMISAADAETARRFGLRIALTTGRWTRLRPMPV